MLRRALVWAVFVLFVVGSAALSATASTRLLGPPTADAIPIPTCLDTERTSGTVDQCQRSQEYQAYQATLRHVQGNPSAADACSGASAECSYQEAQAQIQDEQRQLAATQACSRIIDDASRAACLASASLANSKMFAEGKAQADATWVARADAACQQGDPTSIDTQEMCEHVSEYLLRATQTATPYPPYCQGLAAPDPRCTGGN